MAVRQDHRRHSHGPLQWLDVTLVLSKDLRRRRQGPSEQPADQRMLPDVCAIAVIQVGGAIEKRHPAALAEPPCQRNRGRGRLHHAKVRPGLAQRTPESPYTRERVSIEHASSQESHAFPVLNGLLAVVCHDTRHLETVILGQFRTEIIEIDFRAAQDSFRRRVEERVRLRADEADSYTYATSCHSGFLPPGALGTWLGGVGTRTRLSCLFAAVPQGDSFEISHSRTSRISHTIIALPPPQGKAPGGRRCPGRGSGRWSRGLSVGQSNVAGASGARCAAKARARSSGRLRVRLSGGSSSSPKNATSVVSMLAAGAPPIRRQRNMRV